MPKKILINTVPTFFFLSAACQSLYIELSSSSSSSSSTASTTTTKRGANWSYYNIRRDDPALIEAVETLGLKRAGRAPSKLKIVEIPDDVVDWVIVDDDGKECVMERVRRMWD